jgi:hypothetical protein
MKSESSRLRLSRQKKTKKNAALEAAQEVMIRRVMNEMTGDLLSCVSLIKTLKPEISALFSVNASQA